VRTRLVYSFPEEGRNFRGKYRRRVFFLPICSKNSGDRREGKAALRPSRGRKKERSCRRSPCSGNHTKKRRKTEHLMPSTRGREKKKNGKYAKLAVYWKKRGAPFSQLGQKKEIALLHFRPGELQKRGIFLHFQKREEKKSSPGL